MTRSAGLILILVCVLAGCNRDEQDMSRHQGQPDSAVNAEHQPPEQLTYMPQEKIDSIRIEGTAEPMKLKLVQPPGSLPFLTYVPQDMIFEQVSSGEGEGYYFYTNFAGRKNEEAYLLMFVFPAGTEQTDAVRLVKAYVASRSKDVAPAEYKSFRFKRGETTFVGSIDLRMHGNRYYYLAKQYPEEYGDGFGPRAQRIIEEWKWLR